MLAATVTHLQRCTPTSLIPQIPKEIGGGKWVWRDDTNILEYIGSSNMLFHESGGSRQQRRQKATEKRKDRTTPLKQFTGGVNQHAPTTNMYREQYTNLPNVITLQDVKAVALSRLHEEGMISPSLDSSPLVDDMIARTLQFFHYYFIMEESRKPKPMMALSCSSAQSQEELDKEELQRGQLLESHKRLSAVYGSFLLGLYSQDIHHLNGGKLRYSKTRKDREFYESLYQLLIHCTLLNFENADPDVIRTEMGRLFRSESFNINKREQSQKELEARYPEYFKLKGLNDPNSGPSPAEYRRLRNKRNPFGKAITKQSPIVEGMLKNIQKAPKQGTKTEKAKRSWKVLKAAGAGAAEDSSDLMCNGIGIIGKSIKDYELTTLKKLDEKEKKEMELNEQQNFSRTPSVAGSN